jgi:hypothetical protein
MLLPLLLLLLSSEVLPLLLLPPLLSRLVHLPTEANFMF